MKKIVKYYDWIREEWRETEVDVEKEIENCKKGIHRLEKEAVIGSTIWFRCLVCNKVIKETIRQNDWHD